MSEVQFSTPADQYTDEIDWTRVFKVLWGGRWLILSITAATTVIALIIALLLPNLYRADALLAPNQDEGSGGLTGLAAQYGGLASLAGINLANAPVDKSAMGIEVLRSRKFISDFIERRDILIPLLASDSWNRDTGELKIDPDDYDVSAEKWVRNVGPAKKIIPSLQEAAEEFMEHFTVSQNKKNGFVSISYEHYSPVLAKQWVDWLIEDINSAIMTKDVSEAQKSISYLEKQIQATSLTSLQIIFFRLIEEQTKTVMLAEVSDEYMFETIDPAVAPEKKVSPKRSLIVILGMFLGGLVSVLTVSVLYAFRK